MQAARIGRTVGLRLGLAALAFLAALVAIFGPVSWTATASEHDRITAIFGDVIGVSGSSITIAASDGVAVIGIDAETEIKIGSDEVDIDEVFPRDRVAGTAVRVDGRLVGRQLLIRPAEGLVVHKHVTGVVVRANDETIDIVDRDRNTVRLYVPSTIQLPELSDVVTVVARHERRTGELVAQSITTFDDTVRGLREALARADDEQLRHRLQELIAENHRRRIEALDQALDRANRELAEVPPAAVEAQERLRERTADALERARNDYEADAGAIGRPEIVLTARGFVTSVDARTLTLSPAANDSGRRFGWDETTEVRVEGIPGAGVLDIEPDMPVVIHYVMSAANPLIALITAGEPALPNELLDELEAERARVFHGVITLVDKSLDMVDADGLRDIVAVLLVADDGIGVRMVAKVTEDTVITLNGDEATVDDLSAGQRAEVRLVSGTYLATEVIARTTTSADTHISGVIRDISGDVIVVAPVRGQLQRLVVTDDTVVTNNGGPATLDDLRPNDRVLDATRYDGGTLELRRLAVMSPREIEFQGSVTGLNQAAREITVEQRNGRTITVRVSDDTRLIGDRGQSIDFRDIQVDDRIVAGWYHVVERDGRGHNMAITLEIAPADFKRLHGVVSSVSVTQGTIAIDPRGDSRVELRLAPRAALHKDDRPIEGLGQIATGDIVESAVYATRTRELVSISLLSPGALRARGTVVDIGVTDDGIDRVIVMIGSLPPRPVIPARRAVMGEQLELVVGSSTHITVNGRVAQGGRGVAVGDSISSVHVCSDTGCRALTLHATSRPSVSALQDGRPPGLGTGMSEARPVIETTIAGPIENIQLNTWTVARQRFTVDEHTEYEGARPEIGLIARVLLRVRDDHSFIAVRVNVLPAPGQAPERPAERETSLNDLLSDLADARLVSGSIDRFDAGSAVVIGGVEILITDDTRILGDSPQVGVMATAAVISQDDGALAALGLLVEGGSDPWSGLPDLVTRETVFGEITAMDGDVWALDDSVRFLVLPGETLIRGEAAVGAKAEATLLALPDGSRVAIEVNINAGSGPPGSLSPG